MKPLDPKVLLEFLAASAGIAAFMTLVGGALVWLRLDALDLAADRAVAILPTGFLITVGAHALIGPAIVGLVAVVAIWALDDRSEIALGFAAFLATFAALAAFGHATRAAIILGLILGIAAGVGVALLSTKGGVVIPKGIGLKDRPMVVTLVVVGIGAVALVTRVHKLEVFPSGVITVGVIAFGLTLIFKATQDNPSRSRRPVLWIVFAAFLVAGTAVAMIRTAGEPKLEPIAVLLKSPAQQLAGFYVGESADKLYIAQLRPASNVLGVSAEPVEAIVGIQRSRVLRETMREPTGLDTGDDGREQVQTLLEDLVAEQRVLDGSPAPAPAIIATATPVRTFAPLVSLASDEPSAPMAVDKFLAHSRLYWASPGCSKRRQSFGGALVARKQWTALGRAGGYSVRGRCGKGDTYTSADYTRPYSSGREFDGRRAALKGGEGFYLDLDDKLRKRKLASVSKLDQDVLKPVPVYYEMHPDGAGMRRITYWFFSPFSFPTGTNADLGHEGDWERISVLLRKAQKGWKPLSVRYHAHNGSIDVNWADVRKVPNESGQATHPRAYSARGSHATYRRAGAYRQILARGGLKILAVHDRARACPECPLWLTWQNLVNAEKQPWYGFGGAWGVARTASDFTGPLGPSAQKTLGGKAPSPERALQQSAAAPAVEPVPSVPEK